MPKRSAGLLIYRRRNTAPEVFLVHPGGPYWTKKDLAAWSIPKGEYTADELPLDAAQREFHEETGFTASGPFIPLGEVKQSGGKIVAAWATEGDFDPAQLRSNTFQMEWPPRSGRQIEVPEVDRGCWYSVEEARTKLLTGQLAFLEQFLALIA
jgi:predicted NUDIX family NTP pyrophosphohydrolase